MKKEKAMTAHSVRIIKQLVVWAVVIVALASLALVGCVDTKNGDLERINQQLAAAPKANAIEYSATMSAGEVLTRSLVTNYTLAADGTVTAVSTTRALNMDPVGAEAYVTTTETKQYTAEEAADNVPAIKPLDKKYFTNERFTLTVEGTTTTLQYTPNNTALSELFGLDTQQMVLVSNATVTLTIADAKPTEMVLAYDINQYHAIVRLQLQYTVQ